MPLEKNYGMKTGDYRRTERSMSHTRDGLIMARGTKKKNQNMPSVSQRRRGRGGGGRRHGDGSDGALRRRHGRNHRDDGEEEEEARSSRQRGGRDGGARDSRDSPREREHPRRKSNKDVERSLGRKRNERRDEWKEEEDLWLTDEIGDLSMAKSRYEQRLVEHQRHSKKQREHESIQKNGTQQRNHFNVITGTWNGTR